MSRTYQLGLLGAGNMAEGIVAAVVERGVFAAGQIIASDPAPDRRELFRERFGLTVTDDNRRAAAESACILLAVKPQVFADVAGQIADIVQADQLITSIMAGISTATIESRFGTIRARVVRVMPNLPIRVGAGVAGVCKGTYATQEDLAFVRRLFDAGGQTVVLADESLMHAVTAVSGSGPAYFYYLVEAIVAGGVAAGLKPEDALTLAENTCLGAARMMLETREAPAALRAKVTSPGGTTQAAIEAMDAAGVREAVRNAVLAAAERSRQLGQ